MTSVDLSKGLSAATGLRVPSTLVFDYPTAVAVADYLAEELDGELSAAPEPGGGAAGGGTAGGDTAEPDIRRALASVPIKRLREAGLLDALLRLAGTDGGADGAGSDAARDGGSIETADVNDLINMALSTSGS